MSLQNYKNFFDCAGGIMLECDHQGLQVRLVEREGGIHLKLVGIRSYPE